MPPPSFPAEEEIEEVEEEFEEEPKEEEEPEEEEEEEEDPDEEDEDPEEEGAEEEEEEEEDTHRRETAGVPSSTLVESVNNLCALSGALSEFARQWRDLQNIFDSILASIDARSKHLDAAPPPPSPSPSPTDKPLPKAPDPDPALAELHSLCQRMRSPALRKFVASRLSELEWLRREVPAALPLARDPAALVLSAMGHFYRQNSKGYARPSLLVDTRRACILLLEFYVLSGCLPASAVVDPAVWKAALGASLAWRSRLVKEGGGVHAAGPVDALGLTLFVSCFGIPREFSSEEMYDLLRLSNLKKKAPVLRRSPILLSKLPGIVKDLISKELFVEAVELICAFELTDKFLPLPLLSSFLQKTKQNGNKEREVQYSKSSLKCEGEKELKALKSVVKCLEEYKLDPSELARFQINERIAKLEKDVAEAKQKIQERSLKRKTAEVGLSENPEGKRPWPAAAASSPRVVPKAIRQNHHPKIAAAPSNPNLFYKSYVPSNMLDKGIQGLHSAGANGAEIRWGNNARSLHADGAHNSSMGYPPSGGGSWSRVSPLPAGGPNLYPPRGPQVSSLAGGSRNGSGSSVADLYKFADAVLERGSYHGNSSAGYAVPRPSNFSSHNS